MQNAVTSSFVRIPLKGLSGVYLMLLDYHESA